LISDNIESRYFYLTKKGKFSCHDFSLSDFKNHQKNFDHILDTLAASMRQGLFFPYPSEQKCKFCDFRPICSKDVMSLFNRKKNTDKKIAPFLDMKEIK